MVEVERGLVVVLGGCGGWLGIVEKVWEGYFVGGYG